LIYFARRAANARRASMPTKPTTTTASAAPEKTAHDYEITRCPGGTGERREKLGTLEIADLWHIAQSLAPLSPKGCEAILDVWHLAHDLKRELATAFELIVALQGALNKRSEQFAEAIDALRELLQWAPPPREPMRRDKRAHFIAWEKARRLVARAEGRGQ
jgi:hypothetical protein